MLLDPGSACGKVKNVGGKSKNEQEDGKVTLNFNETFAQSYAFSFTIKKRELKRKHDYFDVYVEFCYKIINE